MLNIKQFVHNLGHYAWLVGLLTILGLAAGYFIPEVMATPTYKSTTTFVVKVGEQTPEGTLANALTQNQVDTQMLSTYKDVLNESSLLDVAVKDLTPAEQAKLSANGGESVTIDNEVNSRVFRINVTTGDAALSAKVANQMLAHFQVQMTTLSSETGKIAVISKAVAGAATVGAKTKLYAVTGAVGMLALGFFFVLCLTLFDGRVRSLSFFSSRDLPVYGEIPSLQDKR